MKKIIVIALAALVALAACTKVNPEEKKADAISFEVATYMTKAQGNNFLKECSSFYTNAWYYPASGDAQNYMPNVQILPNSTTAPTQWAPAVAYYWPKSGMINFFSYASKNALSANELDLGNNYTNKGGQIKITNHTVVADDNIMIADAVYNATNASHNAAGTEVTDDLAPNTTDSNFKGVPTMFRHLLAQVKFNIGLATTSSHDGTNYIAKVTSAKVEKVVNKGSITLTAGTTTSTALTTMPWSPASDGTVAGWTKSTVTTDVEDLTLSNNGNLTLAEDATTGDPLLFLDFRSVLPQALADDVVITIKYDLQALHGQTVYITEKDLEVSAKLNTAKLNATTAITTWCMNTRYTYNITIDPVTEVIIFDPAVADWNYATGTIAF